MFVPTLEIIRGTGKVKDIGNKKDIESVTMEQFLGILDVLCQSTPGQSTWEVYERYYKRKKNEVCLSAFINFEYNMVLNMEALAEKYSVLPFAGGMLDQPNKLIQCFETICDARAHYEKMMIEKAEEKK